MEKLRKSGRRRVAAVAALALAVGAFASLGATGYAARLVAFSHTSPDAAQYPASKVTICHHTHSQKNPFVTITVSVHALPAHLRHGDTAGPCSQEAPSTPALPAKQKKTHKAHPSKHTGNRSQLHGHGKPAKTKPAGSNHGQSKGQDFATTHGKSQGKGHDPAKTHGKSQGKGHDPAKTHGQGSGHGQGQGSGHGQGQGGQGHGQGQGGTHGSNSGGGKGKGHKP
jgi:uncharacterized membrane protein YgcG